MRLGVLDVGSNSVHLEVIDGHRSGPPIPYKSFKHDIKLTDFIDPQGDLSAIGISSLLRAISESTSEAEKLELDELLAFATSAIREANNSERVLREVLDQTGVDLQVLSGDEEAQFTFLAARRWFGWSVGDLLVFDIGGGSLEIARGEEESASFTTSVLLGAGRLTRTFLKGDPFTEKSINELEKYIDEILEPLKPQLSSYVNGSAVGTSKTFRTLEKLCQNFLSKKYVGITREGINEITSGLIKMTHKERRDLQGVSNTRAYQIVAGALVARQIFEKFPIKSIQTCPWALREGIVLRRLDWFS
jgi:exopolyphosphatase/guanosine-5'-triphosphate,3'-diphosphate pyrophosphatase